MKRLIILLWIFSVYSYASLIGSNFSQRDLQVLDDLDIKSSFITDYKLQETYAYYQNRRNSYQYIEKLSEASLFVPRVKDILRQQNIPDVFIYMAMAESNFDIDARSYVRATGLWQFMDVTARKYGLQIDSYVDERMDLVKSTVAAAKYLNYLHSEFGKWYMAAISYNCGEGRMIEAITRATLDMFIEQNPSQKNNERIESYRKTIKDYQERKVPFYKLGRIYKEVSRWDIKPDLEDLLKVQDNLDRQYLPRESRNYIRKIISLGMMNSQDFISNKENSHLLNLGISTTVATIPVKGGLHLRNIAKAIKMSYTDLYSLNKHIKKSIIPPNQKYYTINIPYSRLAVYNQNKNSIQDTKYAMHTVKRGDTLSGIARKYNTTISQIKEQNKLKSNMLSLKQKLLLPIPSDMLGKIDFNDKKSSKKSKRSARKHTVKSGDSLYSIAKKYKVGVKRLMKDNKLKSHLLKIGDRLVIR